MSTEPMQFTFNSDLPTSEPSNPGEFPPANPSPCARITTRVFRPNSNQVITVQNVLLETMRPPGGRMEADAFVGSSSSDSSAGSGSSCSSVSMQSMETEGSHNNHSDHMRNHDQGGIERAYWMQRTIRDAIYGRVWYALVLKKCFRTDPCTGEAAEWEVTDEKCAIKEMCWQKISRQKNKLAENPIQEVAAMQHVHQYWEQRHKNSDQNNENNSDSKYSSSGSSFKAIKDSNVMMPLDLLSDDRYLYSIMPYCDGGELFERLDMNERFSEDESRYWMHQVLNGIENLQHAGVCHRDMSLENLLVHDNGTLVIDMGMCLRVPFEKNDECVVNNNMATSESKLSNAMSDMVIDTTEQLYIGPNDNDSTAVISAQQQLAQQQRRRPPLLIKSCRSRLRALIKPQGTCGKWLYMSPEIYQNSQGFDGFAVDMWAAGVILFLMMTGFPPWERACMTDERFKYMTNGYLVQMLTEWDLGLSPDGMDLLQRMLFLDPKDRLSLDQVRAHPWMINGRRVVESASTMDEI